MLQPSERLEFVDFPAPSPDPGLLPQLTPEQVVMEAALGQGFLALQSCSACGRRRFPVAPICPYCRSPRFEWVAHSGHGTVHTWVRYHRGFVPDFAGLIPYTVLSVELNDGPRVVGRLVSAGGIVTGSSVRGVSERWPGGRHVLAFAVMDGKT